MDNINAAGESVKLDLVLLQGSNQAPAQPEQPSGCLIATAAFGSELDEHVQYLRNFREQYVLSTASGSAFMNAFNAVYYSFSPQVAEYERENAWLQDAVKVGLYPLFGILVASEHAHSVVGGEAGTILAGTTASSLIGAVYLVPAGIAARKVRSRMVLAMVGAVTSLLLVTLAFVPLALPVSTSVFVLGVAGASAVMAAKAAFAFKRRYF